MQGLFANSMGSCIESFALGDLEELLKQRSHLPGRYCVDPQSAACFYPEFIFCRVGPGTHKNPEVAAGLVAQQILAVSIRGAIDVSQEQITPLREGGDETGRMHTFEILRREEHPRIPGMHCKREHLAA